MAIETRCYGCGKQLRVAEEYAGRQARCPECGYVYSVPSASADSDSHAGDPPPDTSPANPTELDADETANSNTDPLPQTPVADQWYMKTPEGQIYGPTPRQTLHQWVSEGRVTDDCQLRRGEHGEWNSAGEVFPQLRQTQSFHSGGTYASGYPVGGYGQTYRPSGYPTGRHVQPHRGGLILTFAILGWAFCPIFSVVAWTMGATDMQQMRRGHMDNAGIGMTQAGQVLGMINTILAGIGIVLIFLVMLCSAAANA